MRCSAGEGEGALSAKHDNRSLFEAALAEAWLGIAPVLETSATLHLALLQRDGTVLWANPTMAAFLNEEVSSLPGRDLADFLASFDLRTVRDCLAASGNASTEASLVNFLLSDHSVQTLHCSFLPLATAVLLLGEPTLDTNRLLQEELLQLNNQLSVLARENTRKGRELERSVHALSEEVRLRKDAEAELVLYKTDLEKVVLERTADLREANQTLLCTQFAMDRSKDAVFWITKKGRVAYINEPAAQLTGHREHESFDLTVDDLDPVQTPGRWLLLWKETQDRGGFEFETVFRAKNRGPVPVEVWANHLSYAGEEYLCWFVRPSAVPAGAKRSAAPSDAPRSRRSKGGSRT